MASGSKKLLRKDHDTTTKRCFTDAAKNENAPNGNTGKGSAGAEFIFKLNARTLRAVSLSLCVGGARRSGGERGEAYGGANG